MLSGFDLSDHQLTTISTWAEVAILVYMLWEGIAPKLQAKLGGKSVTPAIDHPRSVIWPTVWANRTIILATVGLAIVIWLNIRQWSSADMGALNAERDNLQRQLIDALAIQRAGALPLTLGGSTTRGPISWSYEPRILVLGSGPDAQIAGLLFEGVSSEPVEMSDAYLISSLSKRRENLKAYVTHRGLFPVNQVVLPPLSHFGLMFQLQPPLTLAEFTDQWGSLRITADYGQTEYQQAYESDFFGQLAKETIQSTFGPRVTVKGQ